MEATEGELRAIRSTLLEEAAAGHLYLVVNGEKVAADPNSTSTFNHLDCPQGMVQDYDAKCCGKQFVWTFFSWRKP